MANPYQSLAPYSFKTFKLLNVIVGGIENHYGNNSFVISKVGSYNVHVICFILGWHQYD